MHEASQGGTNELDQKGSGKACSTVEKEKKVKFAPPHVHTFMFAAQTDNFSLNR